MNHRSIKDLETQILRHEEEIERREQEIADEEKKILSIDQHIMENLEAAKQETGFASVLYRHRFLISLVATAAVALIWYGIGILIVDVPVLSSGLGALGAGLLLLFLINRYASPKN